MAILRPAHTTAASPVPTRLVGAADIDITPEYPVRLSGYGGRRSTHEGVDQPIKAKALAIGGDHELAILLTVDNCGVPFSLRLRVLQRLQREIRLPNERFAIASSHTHSAPMLEGVLPNLFSMDIPEQHRAGIKRYTAELTENLVKVALEAVANRRPSRLDWGVGTADFANNRRTRGGPVDHALPALRVRDADGELRAVLVNYACHCTTLGGNYNRICGDWAGFAQDAFEKKHPGALLLVAIGCGADQNPKLRHSPNHGFDYAIQHGRELADQADKLIASNTMKPITGELNCATEDASLEFESRTRDEWLERAAHKQANIAYHARKNLERLNRGESLQTRLDYTVQTWSFGDQLAMVFLPGEVVVDYALRLKREFDRSRLWINAYANDVPCYIPSERILREGGYEGEASMVYYDRPNKFKPGLENKIVQAVKKTVPNTFRQPQQTAETSFPTPAADSVALMHTKPGFHIEVVAAEPLIVDPVAIDFGIDGKLWVVEMHDYPSGLDGDWRPGGRVKFLNDLDADGHYDKASLFLDKLPFPTDVMAWRNGALICSAPDILYAEDTDGDGKADEVRTLFTGFITDNYQARVNGLSWGLDNWVYGANGLRGGVIKTLSTGNEVNIRSKDFRMKPDLGLFETASGYTQQGRVRNDWGDWFGGNNSSSLFQYPLPEHCRNRNPHATLPPDRHYVPTGENPERIYPASELVPRFNRPEHANRVTGGCGVGVYRDVVLGADYLGDAFICAPVHNLVRRLKLSGDGPALSGHRAPDEERSEFLASSDTWFRPVQAMTGPDGALWVVDMYRHVIEHPRWIPAERLATLNVRAGSDKGRIYRVFPRGKRLANHAALANLKSAVLAEKLNSSNGTLRDAVHQELVRRRDKTAVPILEKLARGGKSPAIRLQALCVLDGLGALRDASLLNALADSHPQVRRHAVRLSEARVTGNPLLADALLKLVNDERPRVRFQLALTLGSWRDPRAGAALGRLLTNAANDEWLQAAVLSSATTQPEEIFHAAAHSGTTNARSGDAMGQLLATAAAGAHHERVGRILTTLAPALQRDEAWSWMTLASAQRTLDRRPAILASLEASENPATRNAVDTIRQAYARARQIAPDPARPLSLRTAATTLLEYPSNDVEADLAILSTILDAPDSPQLQAIASETIARRAPEHAPRILLRNWAKHQPALRSRIIAKLITRASWISALLDAVEAQVVAPADFDSITRLRLSRHRAPDIAKRVATLLPSHNSTDRNAVIQRYQIALNLAGDQTAGALVFTANCAPCHRLKGRGHPVGPNLSVYRNKGAADWLEAILDPNAVIEPRFVNYMIETTDDRVLSGLITDESVGALTLTLAQGIKETVARDGIREIRASALSLMPEGLEAAIPPQAMADLIAYLKH